MSNNFYLKRDRFSWRWKQIPSSGWNHFSDDVQDKGAMIRYFTHNGRRDPVEVRFVNDNLQATNYFEITKDRRNAILNAGERTVPLYDTDFFSNQDQEEFFRSRTAPDVAERADQVQDIWKRIQFFKSSADDHTMQDFVRLISEKKSDGMIRNYLADYDPGIKSIVYFLEDSVMPYKKG